MSVTFHKKSLFGKPWNSIILSRLVSKNSSSEGEWQQPKLGFQETQLMYLLLFQDYQFRSSCCYDHLWFQLYPTPDRKHHKNTSRKSWQAGFPVCALTVDTRLVGNRRQVHKRFNWSEQATSNRETLKEFCQTRHELSPTRRSRGIMIYLASSKHQKWNCWIKGIVTREDAPRVYSWSRWNLLSEPWRTAIGSNRDHMNAYLNMDEIKAEFPF